MSRPRRLTATRALNLILNMENEDDGDEQSDDAELYENEIENDEGEEVEIEQEDGDIPILSEGSSDSDEESETYESAGINYSDRPFEQRRRQRNVITTHPRTTVRPQSESETFHLFMSDDIAAYSALHK